MKTHFMLYKFTNQVTQHDDGAASGSCSRTETQRDHPKLSADLNTYTNPELHGKCFKITEKNKSYLTKTSEIFILKVILFSSWSDIN